MRTKEEIQEQINNLESEVEILLENYRKLNPKDDEYEFEQCFLNIGIRNAKIEALKWVLIV